MAVFAKKVINVGTVPNDDTGDTLRQGGIDSNDNFTALFDQITYEIGGATGIVFDISGNSSLTGNVSMGGISAGEKLLLEGPATANARMIFSQTGAGLTTQLQQGGTAFSIAAIGAQSLILDTGGAATLTLDNNKNLLLGSATAPASSVGSMTIPNGTAPTGSVADATILFSKDVAASSELHVRDEAGNETVLSPHAAPLLPDGVFEEPMGFGYYSEQHVMEEIIIPEEIKVSKRQKTKKVKVEIDTIEMRNGIATLVKISKTIDQPQFKEHLIVNEDGSPKMIEISPAVEAKAALYNEAGNLVEPEIQPRDAILKQAVYRESIMESVEEIIPEHKELRDTGEVKKINVDWLKTIRLVEAQSGEKLVYEE